MKKIYKIEDLKEMIYREEFKDEYERYVIYTEIVSVARSGMSRQIKFYLKNKETEEIFNITEAVSELLDYKLTTKDAIRIRGCGFNVAWDTVGRILKRLEVISEETFYTIKWDYRDYSYIN